MPGELDLNADALTVGSWLKELRAKAGITQEDLAQAVGTDRRAILRYENEGHIPNALTFLRILSALRVQIDPPPPEKLPRAVNAELVALREAVEALVASESRGVRLGGAPRELPSPEETADGMAELERSRKKPQGAKRRSRRGDRPDASPNPGPAKP